MDVINHVQHDRFFLANVVQPFLEEGIAGIRWWRERLKEFDENRARATAESMDTDDPIHLPPIIGDAEELDASRRSIVLMLQQLCAMGKNVQLPTRLTLFRNLIDRAILFPVQWALAQDENDEQGKQVISAAGEVLSVLLDHDINGVRGFVLRQMTEADSEQKNTLLSLMCINMIRSRDLAVQCQTGDALRLMLEIPLNDPTDPTSQVCCDLDMIFRASHRFNRHRSLLSYCSVPRTTLASKNSWSTFTRVVSRRSSSPSVIYRSSGSYKVSPPSQCSPLPLIFGRRAHPPHVEGTNKFIPLPLRSVVQFFASAFFPQSLLPSLLQHLYPNSLPSFIPR